MQSIGAPIITPAIEGARKFTHVGYCAHDATAYHSHIALFCVDERVTAARPANPIETRSRQMFVLSHNSRLGMAVIVASGAAIAAMHRPTRNERVT